MPPLSVSLFIAAALLALVLYLAFFRRRRRKPKYRNSRYLTEKKLEPTPPSHHLHPNFALNTSRGQYKMILGTEGKFYKSETDESVVTALMLYTVLVHFDRMFVQQPQDYVEDMTFDEASEISQAELAQFWGLTGPKTNSVGNSGTGNWLLA